MSSIQKIISFIHREGWKFSFIALVFSIGLSFIYLPLSLIGFCITFFIIWFFRDPERVSPNIPNTLVSSADGEICLIDDSSATKGIRTERDKNAKNMHIYECF